MGVIILNLMFGPISKNFIHCIWVIVSYLKEHIFYTKSRKVYVEVVTKITTWLDRVWISYGFSSCKRVKIKNKIDCKHKYSSRFSFVVELVCISILDRMFRGESYKRQIIEASQVFSSRFGHSYFKFLNNVESTKLGLLLNPSGQKIHCYLLKHLVRGSISNIGLTNDGVAPWLETNHFVVTHAFKGQARLTLNWGQRLGISQLRLNLGWINNHLIGGQFCLSPPPQVLENHSDLPWEGET